MFRNTFQCGFLSILYSVGSKPLLIWECHVKNGHIKRLTDPEIRSAAIEIMGRNVSTAYITCPAEPTKTLGIKLPFFVMIVKNMKKYFTFEISVLDDKGLRRRFRASNFTSRTRIEPFICNMPMCLDPGWNQVTFNLADFVQRAYGTNYIETLRVQVHANVRIRRIFFSDRLYEEEDLPPEFRILPDRVRSLPPHVAPRALLILLLLLLFLPHDHHRDRAAPVARPQLLFGRRRPSRLRPLPPNQRPQARPRAVMFMMMMVPESRRTMLAMMVPARTARTLLKQICCKICVRSSMS